MSVIQEFLESEADTRAKLIDPAIHACGWIEDQIRREETSGAVQVVDGKPRKLPKGRIDYILRLKVNAEAQPVAIALIEAKAEKHPPTHGLEQAKRYAQGSKRHNVPFIYSTNGRLFVEYDHCTGLTSSPRPIVEFPSPQELRTRYEAHMGFSLDDPVAKPLLSRYPGGEATRRYYQDAAIRAVLEKMAHCEKAGEPKRALLSLATGSGKTLIAVHLLRKFADAGQLRKALFVCDRDELRTQANGAFQNVFGSDAAIVSSTKPQKNARILIATYQTLGIDSEESDSTFLRENYPEDYFSHIIIDECHRSAWGKWSEVLTRNPNAIQVGLTATPRQIKVSKGDESEKDAQITADNIRYFGEPVYEYDMSQGIEDGYLAACEIVKGRVDIDDTGITLEEVLARNPIDANTGELLTEEDLRSLYEKTTFEDKILLPDRVLAMTSDLFEYLLDTGGPEQKSIIFCVRDRHADEVAIAMSNLYANWCKNSDKKPVESYAFKCTAASSGGDYLADLRGSSRSHFVATTVELLTTGVDVPCVRNIVFFKYVRSPIAFYQMIGRGTRLDPASEKLMFRVYDYTNATRLFGDLPPTVMKKAGEVREGPGEYHPTVQVEGFDVRVTEAGRYIVTNVDGKAMPVTIEEYKERIAQELVEEAPTPDAFRERWIVPETRRGLLAHLPEGRRSVELIRKLEDMELFDLYDVLAELGYGLAPKTREERADAFNYKHEDWLSGLPVDVAATLKALVMQFAVAGTDELENPLIFDTPEVRRAGGLTALKALGSAAEALKETKERIFAA